LSLAANVCLFRRLQEISGQDSRRFDKMVATTAVAIVALSYARDALIAIRQDSRWFTINASITVLFIFVCAMFFLLYGLKLLYRMLMFVGGRKQSVHFHDIIKLVVGVEIAPHSATKRPIAVWITMSSVLMFM
jgi:hypothetical protein